LSRYGYTVHKIIKMIYETSSRGANVQRPVFFSVISLILVLTMSRFVYASDVLSPDDFKLQSFSKTVDFFDFARSYAASAGKPIPPANWHAYLYQNYINVSGFQLYYSGLINITAGQGALTVPVQSFMEHYKTPNGKNVLTSSSFIMLLAFNDTKASLYQDSPDRNDTLWASFSLGYDLGNIYRNVSRPTLTSRTEIIPLTSSSDKLMWEWGMRYTNLTAIWWRMFTDPVNPRFEGFPMAITTYEELEFRYKLILNPTNHEATVTASYVIGRMTNLWLIWRFFLVPVVAHLNSTGTYLPNGAKISDENLYQFLKREQIKMSIVLFQNSLVLDSVTKNTFNNQNVTDSEIDVSSGKISTEAANEKIFEVDFGTKKQYKLYNYTADSDGKKYETYDSVTRTAPRSGFAKNPLFSVHVALLRYVPLVVKHIDPALFEKAKDHILSMEYADYFYITSYPKYNGFRVEHDPTYTAYIATSPTSAGPQNYYRLVAIGGIITAAIIGAAFVIKKHFSKSQHIRSSTQTS